MRITRTLLTLALVPVLGLAACGGDDDSDAGGATTTAATSDVSRSSGGDLSNVGYFVAGSDPSWGDCQQGAHIVGGIVSRRGGIPKIAVMSDAFPSEQPSIASGAQVRYGLSRPRCADSIAPA
jgi:hypothetical protein